MKDNIKNNFDLRKYYKKLIRKKHAVIIPFVLTSLLAVLFAFKQKSMFESSTTILVGEPNLMSENLDRIALNVNTMVKLNVIKQVLLSQNSLIELINKLHLKDNPQLRNNALAIQAEYPNLNIEEIMDKLLITGLREQIKIKTSRDNIITISAKSDDPDKVYQLVKTLAESFMNQVIESDYERLRQFMDFSSQQLKIYENKLRNSETKLKQFEQSFGVLSKDSDGLPSKSQLEKYNTLQAFLSEEITQKKNEFNGIKAKLDKLNFSYFLPASDELGNLADQYNTLGQKMLNGEIQSPLFETNGTQVNEEMDILRRQISAEIRNIINAKLNITIDEIFKLVVLAEITQKDLDMLNYRSKKLSSLINSYNSKIAQQPAHEGTLAKLRREVETDREIYNTFLKQSQGSFITEALQKREVDYKFKIIEPAARPMERTNSRKKVVLIGGLLAALVSLSTFSIAELLDNSFSEIDEIENYLQLSVLGAVPKIKYIEKSRLKITLSAALAIGTLLLVILMIKY